jgi:hypothetical protein
MYVEKNGDLVLESGDTPPKEGVWVEYRVPKCRRCDERCLVIHQLMDKIKELEQKLVTNRRNIGENAGVSD